MRSAASCAAERGLWIREDSRVLRQRHNTMLVSSYTEQGGNRYEAPQLHVVEGEWDQKYVL